MLPELKIGSHTNVWHSARTVHVAMGLQEYPAQIDFHNTPMREWNPFSTTPWLERHYSKDVRDLVSECLQWNPDARPKLSDLLQRIERLLPEHTNGMDVYTTTRPRREVVHSLSDKYRLGMPYIRT